MDDLSDSNPSTESEGGGEVCPIVTSAQSLMKENGIGGGWCTDRLYLSLRCKIVSHLSEMLKRWPILLKNASVFCLLNGRHMRKESLETFQFFSQSVHVAAEHRIHRLNDGEHFSKGIKPVAYITHTRSSREQELCVR